jgi:hypothetical protein
MEPIEEKISVLVERIRPILSNQEPTIQGAVVAELLSIWLAQMWVVGDAETTQKLRSEALRAFFELVGAMTDRKISTLRTEQPNTLRTEGGYDLG